MSNLLLTSDSFACIQGLSMRQAVTVPTRSISAYMMRVVVELRELGQAAQHKEHAVLPKQHAI